ncbi:nicotinamide mononucleotide transporter [Chitinophaga agrisoli]|uniref:Nicotinamide riboside transporter PnuC n=1 Tax=Chitinophaga agrisoli TaxID=2607653 RepID=A0A5B2VW60_9BACT|nr:nicotinamide riboside transporter PnuC [Chitinophaga agrisoli]KAA2243365.1 nicotinamide mononucleotide transporter [Chitinophaga agrisoli]
MSFFNIDHIAFGIIGYQISYIELIGVISGLISVYYASKTNVLTWPTGIINEIALFVLFFQVQLYADMFLQVYFLVVTLFGWYNWQTRSATLPVSRLSRNGIAWYSILLLIGALAIGSVISRLHVWLPRYFLLPAAYPYIDSFVMMASILATMLLAQKQVETWVLWIAVDVICVTLYFVKGVYFLSLEYLIFLGLAILGLVAWKKALVYE